MPQPDRAPAFQFYPRDFLSDPNVLAMDNQQIGVYTKLLCICWMQDGMPDDAAALARMVGESEEWMTTAGVAVLACFKTAKGGARGARGGARLHHPRLMAERKRQIDRRKERSEAGKKGNQKRWQDQQDTSLSDRSAIANGRSSSPSATASLFSESPTETSLAKEHVPSERRPAPVLPTKRLWGNGTAYLVKHGSKERNAKSLIGKWLKGREPEDVLAAFRAAQKANTGDPVAYIEKALGNLVKRGDADAAWSTARELATDCSSAAEQAPPRINAAVIAIGGWNAIGRANDFQMNDLRQRFAENYREAKR